MSASAQPDPFDVRVVDGQLEEIVDGELVLEDERRSLAPTVTSGAALVAVASPAVQAAAAAATGFVAGAATLAIVRRREARRTTRTAIRRRAADALPILGTRSFLIDVHFLRDE